MPYANFYDFFTSFPVNKPYFPNRKFYWETTSEGSAVKAISDNKEQTFFYPVKNQDVIVKYAVWLLYQRFLDTDYNRGNNLVDIVAPTEGIAKHLIKEIKELTEFVFTDDFLPANHRPFIYMDSSDSVNIFSRVIDYVVNEKPVFKVFDFTLRVIVGIPWVVKPDYYCQLIDTYIYSYIPDIQSEPDNSAVLKILLGSALRLDFNLIQLPLVDVP